VAALKIFKNSQSKGAEVLSLEPRNFSEQELNPYTAEKTQHRFLAGKNFILQILILKRFQSQDLDSGTELSFAVVPQCSTIKLIHIMAADYHSSGPFAGLDPFQTPLRQTRTSLHPHLNLAFSFNSIIFL
jgi:hypothetical protein